MNFDYSNYWNHSCRPNTLPLGEDLWVAIRDIPAGEQLTIDYACFDSNGFICIERCLCRQPECREFVRGDDYRIRELQQKYAGHFLPYIQRKIDEENQLMAAGGIVGGVGGPDNRFDAASVRAYHQCTKVDIAAHNARGVAELVARFAAHADLNDTRSTSDSSTEASHHTLHGQTTSGSSGSSDSSSDSSPESQSPRQSSSPPLDEQQQAPAVVVVPARKGATRMRRAVMPVARKPMMSPTHTTAATTTTVAVDV